MWKHHGYTFLARNKAWGSQLGRYINIERAKCAREFGIWTWIGLYLTRLRRGSFLRFFPIRDIVQQSLGSPGKGYRAARLLSLCFFPIILIVWGELSQWYRLEAIIRLEANRLIIAGVCAWRLPGCAAQLLASLRFSPIGPGVPRQRGVRSDLTTKPGPTGNC